MIRRRALLRTNAFASHSHRWTPYVAREALLSPTEHRFYHALRIAVRSEAIVFVKVRLADLVECIDGVADHHFRRIAQKHLDFVLCHANSCRVIAAIELDDASHLTAERRERDRFVDEVLASAGILLIHHPARTRYVAATLRIRLQGAIRAMSRRVAVRAKVVDGTRS